MAVDGLGPAKSPIVRFASEIAALTAAGAEKVFREVVSGAKTDRAQHARLLDQLDAGDVLTVMRLDRLGRSTRDLLNGKFAAMTCCWVASATIATLVYGCGWL
jgi:hypothetical protein